MSHHEEQMARFNENQNLPQATKTVWDAVNKTKADLNNCWGEVRGFNTHVIYDCDDKDYLTDTTNGHDEQYIICTIEGFNQCVKDMSNFAGVELFERYVRVKKELLTKENSDYSHYEQSKSRLDFFLSLGFKTVIDDGFTGIDGKNYVIDDGDCDDFNDLNDAGNKKRFITSFAWRDDFKEEFFAAGNDLFEVKRGTENYAITHWRYNLEALINLQDEHDAKQAQASESLLKAVLEQKEMKLTSEDINWNKDAICAVVSKRENVIETQTCIQVNLNDKHFTPVGAYSFASVYHYVVKRDKEQSKYTPEMQSIKATPIDGMLVRVEYMCQSRGKLVIDTVTYKFEGENDFCALDDKGYCFGIEKEHLIAWHCIDERSELDIAKEKQRELVCHAIWSCTQSIGQHRGEKIAVGLQGQGLLAEIKL